MAFVFRLMAALFILSAATSCSTVIDDFTSTAALTASGAPRGHVYLIRGLIGEVFSRGLDTLAEKLNQHGVPATVHSSYSVGGLADEVIANYRREPGPIILIGHSTGGDAAISIARRLRAANVPVGIIFGFDPTPIAGQVPDNVALFVNLFQKTNPIGGGVVKSGGGFHGRLINVDLREHSEIIHITLDKSSKIHEAVIEEIVGFIASSQVQAGQTSAALPGQGQPMPPLPGTSQPFFLAYVVPSTEPIQIWDSGVQIVPRQGEDLKTVAANYAVPVWLLAQVNRLYPDAPLASGKPLIVPQHMYQIGAPNVSMYAR
jgi:hypothetical protein